MENACTRGRAEDFVFPDDKVLVSTMHKVKGKEFDNVFLVLDNYSINTNATRRVVYVAITRAKASLIIHTNQNYFDPIQVPGFVKQTDNSIYLPPNKIILQTGLADVRLSYYKLNGVMRNTQPVQAGDALIHSPADQFATQHDRKIARLSTAFMSSLSTHLANGYRLHSTEAGYTVLWKCPEDGKSYKVVLPKMWLERE